jgi:hypothetical protein
MRRFWKPDVVLEFDAARHVIAVELERDLHWGTRGTASLGQLLLFDEHNAAYARAA